MMPSLGLKASTSLEQINERLQYKPSVFEFYTDAHDMTTNGLAHLEEMVKYVQSTGIRHIVIHHPMAYDHHHNEVGVSALKDPAGYQFMMSSADALIELAIKLNVQVLIHGGYSDKDAVINAFGDLETARKVIFARLDYFQNIGGHHVMFENSISPTFDYGDEEIEEAVIAHHYRLCYDISHAFIVLHGDNDKLVKSIAHLAIQTVHYHFVDSMGLQHDSLQLGKGKIDWQQVMKVVNPKATNIYEIDLEDQNDSREMRASHDYLTNLLVKA
ncbi:TIM barrel protein [Lactobacillus sp. LC28-10]|uniref:TIM barrel protein n=1 Tax=Secundilactobacillus angelensis TaxID=2722706 RepID=A0ABX1L1I2_9LACO|nr:TIM barrel protein [Secundilactobacillus angelensis]MCH5463024.1 sugar phosphate isomerase/epimerase [Secundilactobacillus angelensis]NLR19355.1 TIM barrel protein [Secundilactobacillus angelensis]